MAKLHNLIATHRVNKIAEYIDAHISEVDSADENGFYPLQLAAREGLLQVVLLLLQTGASPNQTQEGDGFHAESYRTAVNIAIEYQHFHKARPESPDTEAVVPVARIYQKHSVAFWKVTDEDRKELLEPLLDEDEKQSDVEEKKTSSGYVSGYG